MQEEEKPTEGQQNLPSDPEALREALREATCTAVEAVEAWVEWVAWGAVWAA